MDLPTEKCPPDVTGVEARQMIISCPVSDSSCEWLMQDVKFAKSVENLLLGVTSAGWFSFICIFAWSWSVCSRWFCDSVTLWKTIMVHVPFLFLLLQFFFQWSLFKSCLKLSKLNPSFLSAPFHLQRMFPSSAWRGNMHWGEGFR